MNKHISFRQLLLFTSYVLTSLVIGEFHPFSKAEMYNNFPKYADLIVFSNKDNSALNFSKYFDYSTANLTHNEYSAKQSLPTKLTYNQMNYEIGKLLWSQLTPYQQKTLPDTSFYLKRIRYSFVNHQLLLTSTKLYEIKN